MTGRHTFVINIHEASDLSVSQPKWSPRTLHNRCNVSDHEVTKDIFLNTLLLDNLANICIQGKCSGYFRRLCGILVCESICTAKCENMHLQLHLVII